MGAVLPLLGVTDAGLILQLAFCGAPEQVRATAWLNPPAGVIVMVEVVLPPLLTVPELGERTRAKPGETAVIVTDIAAEVDGAKAFDPP